MKDRPFLDRINLPIVTEYATGLSQFEAGNIWNYNVNQLDVISVRKRNAGMQMLLNDAFNRTPPQVIGFGYKADSPFRDVRLRQAVSMMIDRDALIELNTSPSVFTKEGFDVPQRVHSHISAGEEGRWLDPKGKEPRRWREELRAEHPGGEEAAQGCRLRGQGSDLHLLRDQPLQQRLAQAGRGADGHDHAGRHQD